MKFIIIYIVLFQFMQAKNIFAAIDWYTDYKGVVNIINRDLSISCVGSLIHSQWILTSAVCAYKTYNQEMRILFGGDIKDFDNAAHIKNTYIYSTPILENREDDIALLELANPASLEIRTLKLPRVNRILTAKKVRVLQRNYHKLHENNNNNAVLANTTIEGSLAYPYYYTTIIINNEWCDKYPVHVSEKRLCTYESLACEGDEGAPLVTNDNNEVVGIVSVGEVQAAICYQTCGCMFPVTTYTYTFPYRPWIQEITKIAIL